jgi:hypothetical protein
MVKKRVVGWAIRDMGNGDPEIRVRGQKLDEDHARELAEALKDSPEVHTFDLSSNNIGENGTASVAQALHAHHGVQCLDLSLSSIGGGGGAALGKMLTFNTALLQLRLMSCKLGDEGAAGLARGLASNRTLTEIDIAINAIGTAGAKAIAAALAANTVLKCLTIGCNPEIGDAGAIAIMDAVGAVATAAGTAGGGGGRGGARTRGLSTLYLMDCGVGPAGATAAARLLRINSETLVDFSLRSNAIGDAGAREIAGALAANDALTAMELSYNDITGTGIKALQDAIVGNRVRVPLNAEQRAVLALGHSRESCALARLPLDIVRRIATRYWVAQGQRSIELMPEGFDEPPDRIFLRVEAIEDEMRKQIAENQPARKTEPPARRSARNAW